MASGEMAKLGFMARGEWDYTRNQPTRITNAEEAYQARKRMMHEAASAWRKKLIGDARTAS